MSIKPPVKRTGSKPGARTPGSVGVSAPAPTPGVKGDARTYHVLVYAQEGMYADNPFMLHILTNKYPSDLFFYIDYANRLIQRYYKSKKMTLRYAGVEELPTSVGEGSFLFRARGSFRGNMELVTSKGNVDLGKLAEFKSYRLTVDYDDPIFEHYIFRFAVNALKVLSESNLKTVSQPQFLRTRRGAHLRVKLSEPIDFEKKVELRYRLDDDRMRVRFDYALRDLGFEGLADTLFNRKLYYQYGGYEEYAETPLQLYAVELPVQLEPTENTIFKTRKYGLVEFKNPIPVETAIKLYNDFKRYEGKYVDATKAAEIIFMRVSPELYQMKTKVDEVLRRLAEL